MGIPSYFSYIVKNHRKIIYKLEDCFKHKKDIDNLYLDSNSIIYDCISNINYVNDEQFESEIIENVCIKLQYYIDIVSPQKKVIIAFDGVAPVAKLKQQRDRRYKSWFLNKLEKKIANKENNVTWNRVKITPGTTFMNMLGEKINERFSDEKIIVTASDEKGEGEHKIFEYIRDNESYHKTTKTVVYGLDADLIMLSLSHLKYCNNIYLYRETPHFIKHIDRTLDPNENYVLNIRELKNIIDDNLKISDKYKKGDSLINDYIFMCFFLGNDFMPHFPALNIRTDGIQRIINAYKHCISSRGERLICSNNKINWKNLRKIVVFLADNENEYLKIEMNKRNKMEKRRYKDKLEKLTNIPMQNREQEKYINIGEYGWEKRYYSTLFNIDIDDDRRRQICINYIEGLEWTYNYYTDQCYDWRWIYKYHYPPLLTDLCRFIPYFETTFVEKKIPYPISAYTQLAYVLPKNALHIIPNNIETLLIERFNDSYKMNCELEWAYCKYLWESHVLLPKIDIIELENEINNYIQPK